MHRREEFRGGINVKMKAQAPSGVPTQEFWGKPLRKRSEKNIFKLRIWLPPMHLCGFNPRPDTVFRHLRSDRGVRPLGVSKRSVVELSGKDQQITLAVYSRLAVLLLVLGHYLTQLWQVKCQIFGNSMIFQLCESISAKLSMLAA